MRLRNVSMCGTVSKGFVVVNLVSKGTFTMKDVGKQRKKKEIT